MKIARLKIIGAAVISVALVTMIFLVSGAAQTEPKFTDAATYYKDGKCVVCHGQKAEKKFDADKKEEDLIERLINRAILKVFDRYVKLDDLKKTVAYFEQGWGVEVSDTSPAEEYMEPLRVIPGLREAINALGPFESPALMAAATEFILEGLHLHQKLNKERHGGRFAYHA